MKHLVFLRPDGIPQIVGLVEGQPPVVLNEDPLVTLVRVTARAAYYKGVTVPASYTFNPDQR